MCVCVARQTLPCPGGQGLEVHRGEAQHLHAPGAPTQREGARAASYRTMGQFQEPIASTIFCLNYCSGPEALPPGQAGKQGSGRPLPVETRGPANFQNSQRPDPPCTDLSASRRRLQAEKGPAVAVFGLHCLKASACPPEEWWSGQASRAGRSSGPLLEQQAKHSPPLGKRQVPCVPWGMQAPENRALTSPTQPFLEHPSRGPDPSARTLADVGPFGGLGTSGRTL